LTPLNGSVRNFNT